MVTEDKKPSGRFGQNLRTLLTRAYEVPEYREDFRQELRGKLKERQ